MIQFYEFINLEKSSNSNKGASNDKEDSFNQKEEPIQLWPSVFKKDEKHP